MTSWVIACVFLRARLTKLLQFRKTNTEREKRSEGASLTLVMHNAKFKS
jgi:hypothetical protein